MEPGVTNIQNKEFLHLLYFFSWRNVSYAQDSVKWLLFIMISKRGKRGWGSGHMCKTIGQKPYVSPCDVSIQKILVCIKAVGGA